MKLRNTFILMILFMGLGSVAIFDPFHWKTKREESKEKEEHLFWLKDGKILNFSITTKDGSFDIGCDDSNGCSLDSLGNWHVQKPIVDVADETAIGSLLVSLKNTRVVESLELEDPGKFGEYGLDAPQLQLSFRMHGDPNSHFLKVGKATAIGSNLYAFSGDRQKVVFIIPAVFMSTASGDLFHWRNKRLIPKLDVNDINSLTWGSYEFKRDNDAWLMKKPIPVRGNEIVLGGLASTLAFLNGKSLFAEDQNSPEGQKLLKSKPVLHIVIGTSKQKEFVVDAFKKPGDAADSKAYVAKVSDRQGLYVLDANALSRFEQDQIEYRERHLLNAKDKMALEKVEFEFPREKKKILFHKVASDWKADGGDDKEKFSVSRINSFLEDLTTVDVEKFVKKQKPKFTDLVLTVSKEKTESVFHFSIDGKANVLVDGELPAEQRRYGLDLLRHLPARYVDLLETNNKKVIVSDPNGKYSQPATSKIDTD